MRIYIAGKMRGLPNYGFDRFDEAKRRGQALGHNCISPADVDRAFGFEGLGKSGTNDADWASCFSIQQVIQRDMDALYTCDALALIPGWENSSGALVELAMARFLGLKILDAATFEPLEIAYAIHPKR